MKKSKIVFTIVLLCGALLLTGCSSKKQAAKTFNDYECIEDGGNNHGFRDKSTHEIAIKPKYSWVLHECYQEKWMRVSDDIKVWYLIDPQGNPLTTKYNYIAPFNEGLALVYTGTGKDYKVGFINEKGTEEIKLELRENSPVISSEAQGTGASRQSFHNGLAAVVQYEKNGDEYTEIGVKYIDKKGVEKITLNGYKGEPFVDGLARVQSIKDRKYRYIDKNMKTMEPSAKYIEQYDKRSTEYTTEIKAMPEIKNY